MSSLRKEAKERNIRLHIHLDEKDLRPFLSMANVVVVPTIKPEAFGRVTVEAMSMEKIVIVNDLGASSEILNNADWTFDHSYVEDFTQKIDKALSLKFEEIKAIGIENRLRASMLYNVETLIELHLQLYKRLLKAE